jgi:L-rhamnose mutarotase
MPVESLVRRAWRIDVKAAFNRRILQLRELRPERVADYIRAHDAISPELVALYRKCGIVEISCFLNGSRLAVFMEIQTDLYEQKRAELEAMPLEQEWQARMAEYDAGGLHPELFDEVYRQSCPQKI